GSTVRSNLLVLAALSVAGSAAAQTGVPAAKTGLSLTPYLGVLVPTADLLSFQNGTATEVTKVSIGFVVGGRLGIGLGRRVALEGDVGYSPGSLDISSNSGTNSTAFNQDVTTLTGSGKITLYLIPRTSPFWIGINGGAGAVRHKLKAGGAAEQAGLKGGTDVGGVVGALAGIRLGRIIAVNVGVEDYLYTAAFDLNNTTVSEKKQHDVRFTAGVHFPFIGF
ncbi:MAG TPA: outer membrane beta-barrel protein, partial [Gemmatimonadales bacterium]|nr:outer membrane beta-barrel protein [Gemmatimonadales bacterium]